VEEVTSFEIGFHWTAVQSSNNISYCFPELVSKYLRDHYSQPAVYRWLIQRDGKTSTYIGETENPARRLNDYLKPGPSQTTNKRVRALLDNERNLNASIALEMLNFEPFEPNRG
jgi:hypothetical protein